jgi:hypothetical protein
MSTRSKLVVAAAIATLGLASPAFAQSFNRPDGTGNELQSCYDSQGGPHAGPFSKICLLLAEAAKMRSPAFGTAPAPGIDSVAATGGRSAAYNKTLQNDQW